MDRASFNSAENWCGSYYELALELGPTGDDARLTDALRALWSYPSLEGPWRERASFMGPHQATAAGPPYQHLYGVVTLNGGVELGCVSHVVREEDGSDWLDLCIPTGMLQLRFPVEYPLETHSNPWIHRLDDLYVAIASDVYSAAGFSLGLIGEEVSGELSSATLTSAEWERGPLLLSESLWTRFSPKREHRRLDNGLMAIGLGNDG